MIYIELICEESSELKYTKLTVMDKETKQVETIYNIAGGLGGEMLANDLKEVIEKDESVEVVIENIDGVMESNDRIKALEILGV